MSGFWGVRGRVEGVVLHSMVALIGVLNGVVYVVQ